MDLLDEQVLDMAKVGHQMEIWNVTDAVEKREVTNPEEKKKEDKTPSENLSLESLAPTVENSSPEI